MRGKAVKCDICGHVAFMSLEMVEDEVLPVDWIKVGHMSVGRWIPTDVCGMDCLSKWISNHKEPVCISES